MYNIINDSRSLFSLGLQTVLSSHKIIQKSTLFDIHIGLVLVIIVVLYVLCAVFHLDRRLAEYTTPCDKIKRKGEGIEQGGNMLPSMMRRRTKQDRIQFHTSRDPRDYHPSNRNYNPTTKV